MFTQFASGGARIVTDGLMVNRAGLVSASASAWSLIANTGAAGTATTATTGGIDTTGANLLVAILVDYKGNPAATFTDSKGNTWTISAESFVASDTRARMAHCVPTSVGSAHTFTLGAATLCYPAVCVSAFSGANATPLDQQNGNAATGVSIQPGSVTPSTSDQMIVTGLGCYGASPSINSAFTITNTVAYVADNNYCASLAYLNSGSAQNPTWSATGSSGMATRIATFKP